MSGSDNLLGPGSELAYNTTTGIRVLGRSVIRGNRVHHNGLGITTEGGSGSTLEQNIVWSNSSCGIRLRAGSTLVRHNTVDRNGTGLCLSSSGNDVRNNAFTTSGGYGISGSNAQLSELDANAYFNHAAGACSSCSPGPNAVSADPLFVNPGSADYRLQSSGPLIDVGVDLGIDVNGPLPGNYSGGGPDIGAWETR